MFIFRTVVWGAILIMVVLVAGPWLALSFDASFPVIELGWATYIGALLITLGILLALYAGIYLVIPGLSRAAPYEAGGAFSLAGPYRYVRNPFMLAVIVMLWGEALYFSRVSLLLYAAIATGLLHAWIVYFEEPSLRAKLGQGYLDYHRQVPRWFPRLRSYRPRSTKHVTRNT